jgi:hypothetical protein
VANGRFNVIIGPKDTNAVSIRDAFGGGDRFLEIKVNGGAPILPRQQFLSNPYAFAVGNSNYELTPDALKAKGSNPILVGEGNAGLPAAMVVQTTNTLTIAGAGADGQSRSIVLDGDVSILGASGLAGPTLSLLGDVSFAGAAAFSNLRVTNALQAGFLTDGVRNLAMTDLLRDDPPLIVDATDFNNTTAWQIKEVDFAVLGNDADGCRVRLFLKHKIEHDNMPPIEMNFWFEQPGMTANPNFPNIVRFSAEIRSFSGIGYVGNPIDGTKQTFLNLYSGPWVQVNSYARNSLNGGADGDPDASNRFKLWFHFHPHVSGRIIVLDN